MHFADLQAAWPEITAHAQHQPQRPHRLPQHGQQGRRTADTVRERPTLPHAVGEHDTPSTPARRTRRPPPLCRQLARPDRTDRASRRTRGHPKREKKSTKGERAKKMRTCARLPAVLPSKSYIDRTPPQTASPAPPQASRHPSPHRLKLPVSRRTPARFYLCQFCFWRVCRTPAYFCPSADEQRHPARLPGRHRHRGSLHIFAPAPFLTKQLSTSTLSRTPHIPIFHSGTISTIPQQ